MYVNRYFPTEEAALAAGRQKRIKRANIFQSPTAGKLPWCLSWNDVPSNYAKPGEEEGKDAQK